MSLSPHLLMKSFACCCLLLAASDRKLLPSIWKRDLGTLEKKEQSECLSISRSKEEEASRRRRRSFFHSSVFQTPPHSAQARSHAFISRLRRRHDHMHALPIDFPIGCGGLETAHMAQYASNKPSLPLFPMKCPNSRDR